MSLFFPFASLKIGSVNWARMRNKTLWPWPLKRFLAFAISSVHIDCQCHCLLALSLSNLLSLGALGISASFHINASMAREKKGKTEVEKRY